MHRRTPAARHRDQVARERAHGSGDRSVDAETGDEGGAHPAASGGIDDRMAADHVQPGVTRFRLPPAIAVGAKIDDRRYVDAMATQIEGRGVGFVVVGDDHRAPAGKDREAVDIGARGACQHHPRPVVVGEHQRPLHGAGRQNDPSGADSPQALARQVRRRAGPEVVGNPFERDQEIMVEVAGDRRPGQNADVIESFQFGRSPAEPSGIGRAQQRPAGQAVFVGENDPRAASPCLPRRREPGRSRADDEDVAMRVHAFVPVGIGAVRRASQPRHPADEPFVEMPAAMRPHEGLVVEPGRDQAVCEVVDRGQVEADARPAIDAVRGETFI